MCVCVCVCVFFYFFYFLQATPSTKCYTENGGLIRWRWRSGSENVVMIIGVELKEELRWVVEVIEEEVKLFVLPLWSLRLLIGFELSCIDVMIDREAESFFFYSSIPMSEMGLMKSS